MTFEPLTFVWVVCTLMAIAGGYMGFGKKALLPFVVALVYTFFFVLFAIAVAFAG